MLYDKTKIVGSVAVYDGELSDKSLNDWFLKLDPKPAFVTVKELDGLGWQRSEAMKSRGNRGVLITAANKHAKGLANWNKPGRDENSTVGESKPRGLKKYYATVEIAETFESVVISMRSETTVNKLTVIPCADGLKIDGIVSPGFVGLVTALIGDVKKFVGNCTETIDGIAVKPGFVCGETTDSTGDLAIANESKRLSALMMTAFLADDLETANAIKTTMRSLTAKPIGESRKPGFYAFVDSVNPAIVESKTVTESIADSVDTRATQNPTDESTIIAEQKAVDRAAIIAEQKAKKGSATTTESVV